MYSRLLFSMSSDKEEFLYVLSSNPNQIDILSQFINGIFKYSFLLVELL